MKYIKVTLREIVGQGAKAREVSLFLLPEEGDTDDEGNVLFREELVRTHKDVRKFANKIKSDVMILRYEILETNAKTLPETYADFLTLDERGGQTELESNEYNIDISRPVQMYGTTAKPGKRRKKAGYLPLIILAAVVVLFAAAVYIYPLIYPYLYPPEPVTELVIEAESEV